MSAVDGRDARPPLPPTTPVAVVAGVLVCAGAVAWLFAAHLFAPPAQRLVDLDVYRQAGRSVLDGRGVYTFLAHPPQRLPFTYPPFAALLAVPLAVLSFPVCSWLWSVGEVATTVAVTALAFTPLLRRAGRWWPLALGVLAGAMQQMLPFRDEIKFGQVDELLVLMCAVDCLMLMRRRGHGVLIGLATAVKLTPGVFIVYLLVAGRRRAAATAAGAFVAASLVAAAFLPGASRTFWTSTMWHSERLRSNANPSNQSLRGMWLRAISDTHTHTALWLASGAVVAVIGFRRAAAASRAGDERTGIALTGLLAVLLSPVSWIHHLCWLPLVLGALVGDGRDRRRTVAAVAVFAFYVVKLPWYGADLLHGGAPVVIARIVEDAYGLMAVVLLFTLRARTSAKFGGSRAETVTVRHNRRSTIRGGPA